MLGLPRLAVRVDLLGERADARGQRGAEAGACRGGVGEREGLQAPRLDVDRIVADTQPAAGGQRPFDVHLARQHTQVQRVAQGDGDQLVVRQHVVAQELKVPVFGGFDRRDVARQAGELRAHVLARLAEDPPQPGVGGAVLALRLGIALRLDPVSHPLVDRREPGAHGIGVQAEEVDHPHPARPVGQVPAVAVGADVPLQPCHAAQPEFRRFGRRDDEPRTVQLDARRGDAQVGTQRLRGGHVGADAQVGVQQGAAFGQCHLHLAALAVLLSGHGHQLAGRCTGRQHRHRNAHRRAVGTVHPGVVGDRKGQVRSVTGQRRLHHAAVEGLPQRVGGDQPQPLRTPGAQFGGGLGPPEHHEVGTVGHTRPARAQGLHVTVAQRLAHRPGADEGRVADDEVRLRPLGGARVQVAPLRQLCRLVGHLLAGDGVALRRAAIPARQQLPVRPIRRLLRIPGQHRIAAIDVAVVVHHRLGHALVAEAADLPLQPADPQHQLGQRRRARVQLDAQELLQRHRLALQAQAALRVAQGGQGIQHLGLHALEVLQRHVQEVAAAAGRVQHPQAAQPVVEAPQLGAGLVQAVGALLAIERLGLAGQQQCGVAGVGPLGAQRLHHRGQHQPLHIGARRVVRAQGMALGGAQRALQQGAEDGRLHLAPVGRGRTLQQLDLLARQRQHVVVGRAALEEFAVEAQQGVRQRRGKAARIHRGPERAQHQRQRGRLLAPVFKQGDEGAAAVLAVLHFGQQPHILREHAEQAAAEESRHTLRRVAGALQPGGQPGQQVRHLAGDAGAGPARVQAQRVQPGGAQAVPGGGTGRAGVAECGQAQAVAACIRKRCVGGAAAAELGIDLHNMAHIDHQQQRRAALPGGQGAGIGLRLGTGAQQGVVEDLAPGPGQHGAVADLLGLGHEGTAPVAVDEAVGAGAVTVVEHHAALEHVGVVARVVTRRVRSRHAQQGAEFGDEELVVGPLAAAGRLPAGVEGGELGGGGVGRRRVRGRSGLHGGVSRVL